MSFHIDSGKYMPNDIPFLFFGALRPYARFILTCLSFDLIQDIVEAKEFLAKKGVDVGSE